MSEYSSGCTYVIRTGEQTDEQLKIALEIAECCQAARSLYVSELMGLHADYPEDYLYDKGADNVEWTRRYSEKVA